MTLINGLFAFGTLAFTIPLVIHLLFRNRFRTVEWGAMHLLSDVIRSNRRRVQWMHWLLLLIRCAIPILLALCLARPLINGLSGGGGAETLLLVLDDSASSGTKLSGNRTRWNEIQDAAIAMIDSIGRRDSVVVIPASQASLPHGTSGRREAIRIIRTIQPLGGPVPVDAMVRSALAAAETAAAQSARIVVLSDFSQSVAPEVGGESLDRLVTAIQSAKNVGISLYPIVADDSPPAQNISISSLRLDAPAAIADEPAVWAATIVNQSDELVEGLLVRFDVAGDVVELPQERRDVSISPRSSLTVRAIAPLPGQQVHPVTVRIDPPATARDDLLVDNSRSIAAAAIGSATALIVDGGLQKQSSIPQSEFLRIALAPFQTQIALQSDPQSTAEGRYRDFVRVETAEPAALVDRLHDHSSGVAKVHVMVLAGVSKLSQETTQQIQQYVSGGGHVLWWDGDSVEDRVWNQNTSDWMPAKLGQIGRNDSPTKVDTELAGEFQPFTGLGDERGHFPLTIKRLRSLELSPQSTSIWRTAGGSVLAARRSVGKGSVIQFAMSSDRDWTNLPLRPQFLPMMQQLVLSMASDQALLSVPTGNLIRVPGNRWMDSPDDAPEPREYRWETPGGNRQVASMSGDGQFRITATDGGLYRLAAIGPDGGVIAETPRAAMIDAAEFDLQFIGDQRLQQIAQRIGIPVFGSLDQWRDNRELQIHGREIWRWLVGLLLLLMIAELLWQQRSTRSSRPVAKGSAASSARRFSAQATPSAGRFQKTSGAT